MRAFFVLLILLLCLAVSGPADAKRKSDQERARRAVEAGELLPLRYILRQLRGEVGGRMLDAEVEEVGPGRWLYFIKVLTPEGNVQNLVVDGATGRVLDVRGRGD